MKVLDLYCGAGGIATGFARAGLKVTGVDINPWIKRIFARNRIGDTVVRDLRPQSVRGRFSIITGGPPCRPWSKLNHGKRGREHPDHPLLERFFEHVFEIQPLIFLLENVEALQNDEVFQEWIQRLRNNGYSVTLRTVSYGDFGAPTRRSRLITAGLRLHEGGNLFFAKLEKYKRQPATVGDAIRRFERFRAGEYPDHVWMNFKTIDKYEKYYRTGKYGWYKLDYSSPAPSFGNVTKTYILHPASGDGMSPRVISIREALAIMGFDDSFSFPQDMGLSMRYQMVADAVSPIFSRACAEVVIDLVSEEEWD